MVWDIVGLNPSYFAEWNRVVDIKGSISCSSNQIDLIYREFYRFPRRFELVLILHYAELCIDRSGREGEGEGEGGEEGEEEEEGDLNRENIGIVDWDRKIYLYYYTLGNWATDKWGVYFPPSSLSSSLRLRSLQKGYNLYNIF